MDGQSVCNKVGTKKNISLTLPSLSQDGNTTVTVGSVTLEPGTWLIQIRATFYQTSGNPVSVIQIFDGNSKIADGTIGGSIFLSETYTFSSAKTLTFKLFNFNSFTNNATSIDRVAYAVRIG